jgi:hypothetical protein
MATSQQGTKRPHSVVKFVKNLTSPQKIKTALKEKANKDCIVGLSGEQIDAVGEKDNPRRNSLDKQ